MKPAFRFRPLAFSLQLSAFSLLFSACNLPSPQSDTVRYFTLSGASVGAAATDAALVRPVRLAGHLRNRALAVRISANEVVYLDDMRWAEPLDEAITQILRNRLRQVPGGAVITVQVQRCELVRNEGNAVQVAATYSIAPASGEPVTGTFTASPRKWAGGDYATLVAQLHEAVDELAETIAPLAGPK